MHWLRVAGGVILIAGIVACSGNDDDIAGEAATTMPQADPSDDITTTSAPEPETVTAEGFVAVVTEAGIPVGDSIVWDEDTDPNGLLGRPGQYIGKATWIDTRVECFFDEPSFDCGGDIEIFANDDDRDDRYDYLAGFAGEGFIGGYYLWRLPNAVVRVGFELPPAQADEYAAVLEEVAPGEVEQYG